MNDCGYDYKSRKIVEALRSGIPSYDVGRYFSSARQDILGEFQDAFDRLADSGTSESRIISGKYGEGKTHLLNTIGSMAQSHNMAVSMVTLSKETPLSNMAHIYSRIMQNTYLPGHVQPGISFIIDQLSLSSAVTSSLLEYILTHLEVNRLYYVFKSLLGTQDDEEKYLLHADLEGDFIAPAAIRKIYRRIFGEAVAFNGNFVRTKHISDYIAFLSRLFRLSGYDGWVILFDEAELIGRLGRRSRHKAYLHMDGFLRPGRIEGVYSVFAFNASFVPDVIEAKHEYEGVEKNDTLLPDMRVKIKETIEKVAGATQLAPLSREETADVLERILRYHGAAYGWKPQMDRSDFMRATDSYGYLLRTRIRAAVEMLDQLYQYGKIGEIRATELGQISFDEDESLSLDEFI
ncbi:MAG: ATP-binding protein [Clostridiales Family XIII bacterium]|jgi:hypothetical protein|nr:ATP-binding protein [Clostridiales Family XIII bacterium]